MESYKLRETYQVEAEAYPHLLSPRKSALRMGLLVLVFMYLYAPVWMALAETWLARDDYSFGFLVPLISLYLVWYRRERLRRLPIQPSHGLGIPAVFAAGAMLVIGRVGNIITLQELSLVAMVAGLVLSMLGKDYLKALGFPIAYLLFMVPIADEIIAPLHWSFQLMTAKMGVAFLQALGIPVYLERQYITLPSITLEVAKACSGINYLISIIALGVPLAYVSQKKVWSRVVLVVSAVTIGVIGNWIRVAAIGLWAYYGGKVVHGPFHVFQALFVSQLGFIALFAGAWILSKVTAGEPANSAAGTATADPRKSLEKNAIENQRRSFNRSWLGVFLILLGLSAYFSLYQHGPIPLKAKFATFPLTIGDWKGQTDSLNGAAFRIENADQELVRVYRDPAGHEIQLYLAYFESQRHPKKLFNYITNRLHHDAVPVHIDIAKGLSIEVNQTVLPGDHGDRPVSFWYNLNGETYADRYEAVRANTINALVHGRTNGALVMIAGVPGDRKKYEEIFKAEQSFIENLVPILRWYLPNGKDNTVATSRS